MAKRISAIVKREISPEEKRKQALQNLLCSVSDNEETFLQTLVFMQELQKSGLLQAATSLLSAKEKVTGIVLSQVSRSPVTNLMTNLMTAAAILTDLRQEEMKKLVDGLKHGLSYANEKVEDDEKTGIMDLVKALKDPDINRSITFGLSFLKGMGKALE